MNPQPPAPHQKAPLVVGIGEALFDLVPEGPALGGAPINTAVHAAQLLRRLGPQGSRVSVATAIGDDALGRRLRAELTDRGIDVSAVQVAARPTGTAEIQLTDGEPSFVITPDVAWDHVQFDPTWSRLAGECSAVCYGTLGSRSRSAREAISRFVETASSAVRLFDVNLRDPFHGPELIRDYCRFATILKVNEREIGIVADAIGVADAPLEQRIEAVRRKANLEAVVLTRGRDGAMVASDSGIHASQACFFTPTPSADAIGAGDAFGATILVGRLLGWPIPKSLALACRVSGFVAARGGATPVLPEDVFSE